MVEDIDSLYEQIDSLKYENSMLSKKLQAYIDGEQAARERIEKAYREADDLKGAATMLYVAELAALKNFQYKWKEFFEKEGVSVVKKQEIIDLLTDFLNKVGVVTEKDAINGIDKAISGAAQKTPEDALIDLDELLNPSKELDLAELCKELGVYNG